MILKFEVDEQTLKLLPTQSVPRKGSRNYLKLKFAMSPLWQGMQATAFLQFEGDCETEKFSEPIPIPASGEIKVPDFFAAKPYFQIYLLGINGETAVPTNTLTVSLDASGESWIVIPDAPPTPDYQALIMLVQEALNRNPEISNTLKAFENALIHYSDCDIIGLPVMDPDAESGYRPMAIEATEEELEEEANIIRVPTLATVRALLGELDAGGLAFDGGFVDAQGYLHLTFEGTDIEGFAPVYIGSAAAAPEDLIIEGDRLYLSKDGEPLGEGVELPKGSGGSDSSTGSVLKLLNRNPNTAFSVMDTAKEALILYTWTSTDAEDGSPTGKGSASWFVGDKRVATQSVDQGDGSFDILPYLETGVENTVKLTLEDAYGTIRSRTWTVTVISFGLTWDLDLMASHKSETLYLRLVPTGMGTKTLHVTLDGKEHHTETVQSSGRSITVEIPALSHGVHRLSAWLELVAEGETVSTEPLEHVGIWVEEGNSTPVIALFRETLSVPQYTTAQLLYLVYDPLTETALITREEKGVSLGTLTVGRGIQSWAYRATEQGTVTLTVCVAMTEVRASAELTVTDLGYDIAPVSAGLVLDCDPAGHSNTESNRHQFGYTDEEGNNHPFLFSEYFDWENGGFRTDPEGVPALLIKRGSTVTLDRSFFDSDASSKGKCIKLILKASNCRDYNASFLSCLSAGVGLELRAQKGSLSSESQAIDFPYCEEEKLEMDLNIHSAGEKHLASVWLHGIPSATFVYSSTDSWAQGSPVPVVIGSGDCDVWLYRMKMYRNSLTRYDILSNYIADAGTTALMMDRYERNDIYAADGTISISKLVNANPDLRVLHIKAPKMTTGKEDQVTCAVELSHKNGKGFTATGVKMKAQGTSSLEYGLAALNLDLDFSKAVWTDQKGETITAFSMRENSIPVDYFNIKLNVASSENANNVCLAEEYNAFQPHRVPARVADPRVRDTVEGTPCAVFLTNTSHSAIAVGARTLGPGETFLYGCGDMNNSKKNFAVFGQDGTDPLQCCVEIKNNNNDPCRFKSDDLSRETWDGEEGTSDFEFRYPKSPTQTMKEAVQRVLSWVVSTDPAQATGQSLPRPVQYGGITYNRDNADYRRAKFKGELADHFSVDSLLYHYLFTEFHLMVDNRAKNTFLSYEYDEAAGGHRWNFCKDYDNDTAAGTDNAGGLTFRYGLEDTDSIGAQKVFNASDSVLWCNLRDTMGKELQDMFQELETAGLFDVDRILQVFKAYQSPRPEALVGEDMWAKYFMPYLNKGEKRYLEMAQGTKEDQRAGFYRYQRPYISSKYQSAYARSDSLSLRANGVSDFTVTPYSDVYVHVKFGEAHSVKLRGEQGEVIPIVCEADTANDLETYLYSAGSISRLGSLAGLMASEIELNSAVKLRNLPLGSDEPGYDNRDLTQLSFGTINNLEVIDLSGLGALTGTLDLTQFDSLREFYGSGCGITGVVFAPNAPVETAILPQVSTLVLRGQGQLRQFRMEGSKLINLRVEDTPMADTLTLVRSAKNLQRGRLLGVNWPDADGDTLLRLAGLTGYDENTRPTDRFVLTGFAHVPTIAQDELDVLHRIFPNLEITAGAIVPYYPVTFQNEDGTILYSRNVRQGGTCPDPIATGDISTPTKEPTVGETFVFAGWDFPLTNVQGPLTLTAQFASQVRKYTVRWFDGGRLLQTDVVEAFEPVSYRGSDLLPEADRLWVGWNKTDAELYSVTKDMDVDAEYISPEIPTAMVTDYDWLYSDDPADGDRSAYTLAQIYGIVRNGLAKDYFRVGDEIKLCPRTSVFPDTNIVMQVYGFNHYPLAEGNGAFAPVVFGMKGLMNILHKMNPVATNIGGWAETEMRSFLNETIFPALPQRWKALIRPVELLYLKSGQTEEVGTCVDRLFLFAYGELWGTSNVPYIYEIHREAENQTFALFTNSSSRIKRYYNGSGSVDSWWTRSPYVGSDNGYTVAYTNGNAANISLSVADKIYAISFGFCL